MIPAQGERALICGQTGSGKTAFACWLLQKIDTSPFVIYDTKIEPKFDAMPRSRRVYSLDAVAEAIDDATLDYVIFQPHEAIVAEPLALDELLWFHYMNFQGVGAYIDEITNFNSSWKADKGMLSLLNRGRSKGITTIMSTQRPKGLARSALTEAQHFYMFFLSDLDDKKRFDAFIPLHSKQPETDPHYFYYKRIGERGPAKLFAPIKIDKKQLKQYIDPVASIDVENSPVAGMPSVGDLVWL